MNKFPSLISFFLITSLVIFFIPQANSQLDVRPSNRDSILLEQLRTYSPEELGRQIKEYYANLDIKDTVDIIGLIGVITLGENYKNVSLDSIIRNYDWNKAIQKVDWNAAMNHVDFNEMMSVLCTMDQSIFEGTPVRFDTLSKSNSKPMPNKGNPMLCMKEMMNPFVMMRAIDIPCFTSKMSLLNKVEEQDPTDMLNRMMKKNDFQDMEMMCKMMSCVDIDLLFEQVNFNCLMKQVDFNAILKDWKMDGMIASMKNKTAAEGHEQAMKDFENNPIFALFNPDSIMAHIYVAYEDFFDARSQSIMDKNFYDHTFGKEWNANQTVYLHELLELITPMFSVFFGESEHSPYVISTLWLFYDMQKANSELDYKKAHQSTTLLKDVIIYILEKDLLKDLDKLELNSGFITEDMLWTLLIALEQMTGNALAELGQHTKALKYFNSALSITDYKFAVQEFRIEEIEKTYFKKEFTDQKRTELLNAFGIDTTVLRLSLDKLMIGKHPKNIKKLLGKKEYRKAFTYYALLKDVLLELGASNKPLSNSNIPNPIADKPLELYFIKTIYEKMISIADEGKLIQTNEERYQKLCDAPKAIEAYQRHFQLISLHNNLGGYYLQLNDYEQSREHLQEAWEGIMQVNKIDYVIPASPGYGTIEIGYLNKASIYTKSAVNVSYIYLLAEEYEEGIDSLESALQRIQEKFRDQIQPINEEEYAMSEEEYLFEIYIQLGRLHLIAENYDEAWKHLSKCEAIAETSKFEMHKVFVYTFLGHYYQKNNQLEIALEYWLKARASAVKTNSTNQIAQIEVLLTSLYDKLGDAKMAEVYFQKSERASLDRSQYTTLHQLYTSKGQYLFNQKDYFNALAYFEKGVQILEDSIFNFTLGERSRQLSISKSYDAYEGAMLSALQLEQKDKVFQYIQRVKSRTLNELLASAVLKGADIPFSLQEEMRDITGQLNQIQQKLLIGNASKELKIQRKRLLHQLQTTKAKIRVAVPKYAEILNTDGLANISNIQAALNPGEAFLEYIVGEQVSAFVITKEGVKSFQMGTNDVLKEKLKAIKLILDQINSTELIRIEDQKGLRMEMNWVGEHLYTQLFAPIQTSGILEGIEHLLISPDAELYLFPMELCRDVNRNQYLVDDYSISYIQSGTTLKSIRTRNKRQKSYAKDLLVIGKSNFGEYPHLSNLGIPRYGTFSTFNKRSDFLMDSQATLQTLQKLNLKDYRYIYFSTHAEISPIPEFSYLALTNSHLALYNIFDLEIQCELLILSACQTAKGAFQRGAGIMGFSRGFMYSGAESLIMSLWPVADEATEAFFTQFFQYLNEGMTPTLALHKTKLDFQKRNDYKAPFYWAGFVLYGVD